MVRYLALCKIIELGSFTRAADVLGYTQAAVSQMIKSLEEEFKINLVIRSRSGIRLTPEGVVLFPIIKNMVSNYRLLSEKVMELTSFESGELRIGISSEVSRSYLSNLVKDFSDLYPGVRFIIKQDYSHELTDMLLQGDITMTFLNHCDLPSISTEHIVTDHYAVVFHKYHYFAYKTSVSLEDLDNESIIIDYNGVSENLKVAISKANITSQVKYSLFDIPSATKMIADGMGVGILPTNLIKDNPYGLMWLPLDPLIESTIFVAYRNDIPLSATAQKFLLYIRENFAEYTSYC